MTLEAWCLCGTAAVTALVVSRILATGRESVMLARQQEQEQALAVQRHHEAVIAELERASSDVDPVSQ